MSIGLVGRKSGMTRIFTESGSSVPVTVVEVLPNKVTQVKTVETDGYSAVQITTGSKKSSHLSKSEAGHYAKAGLEAGRGLWEFRAEVDDLVVGQGEDSKEVAPGVEFTVAAFREGQIVDVTGTSKGKGYQGVIKRHNFRMQDATHGNSLSHRAPGSIGQCQTPGRVWKGKKMSGQMGNERVTTQGLEVVKIDTDNNLILIKGAVPGATGADVIISPTVKSKSSSEG
ncbi:MAG: 50S ribosomal protein L3 [Gammaproteobacteria bacterium]|jgi:large subunit ribosomal protein L3|nr:50S ribosomal protein L3 [Gammaproteobacteria bacterium]